MEAEPGTAEPAESGRRDDTEPTRHGNRRRRLFGDTKTPFEVCCAARVRQPFATTSSCGARRPPSPAPIAGAHSSAAGGSSKGDITHEVQGLSESLHSLSVHDRDVGRAPPVAAAYSGLRLLRRGQGEQARGPPPRNPPILSRRTDRPDWSAGTCMPRS